MDFYISIGGLLMMAHLLTLGLHPEWGMATDYDTLCLLAPSILTFGLLLFLGGLLLKACAFFNFYTLGKNKSIRRQEWLPNLWMLIILVVGAVIVVLWAFEFPPDMTAETITVQTETNSNRTLVEVWRCDGDRNSEFKIAVSALNGGLLLLAAIMVWPAMQVARKQPTSGEASMLTAAVYNMVFAVTAGTLIYFFYDNQRHVIYAIIGGLKLYGILVTYILLIVSKIMAARRDRTAGGDNHYSEVDDDKGSHVGGRHNPAMDHSRNEDTFGSY